MCVRCPADLLKYYSRTPVSSVHSENSEDFTSSSSSTLLPRLDLSWLAKKSKSKLNLETWKIVNGHAILSGIFTSNIQLGEKTAKTTTTKMNESWREATRWSHAEDKEKKPWKLPGKREIRSCNFRTWSNNLIQSRDRKAAVTILLKSAEPDRRNTYLHTTHHSAPVFIIIIIIHTDIDRCKHFL